MTRTHVNSPILLLTVTTFGAVGQTSSVDEFHAVINSLLKPTS